MIKKNLKDNIIQLPYKKFLLHLGLHYMKQFLQVCPFFFANPNMYKQHYLFLKQEIVLV